MKHLIFNILLIVARSKTSLSQQFNNYDEIYSI